MNDATITITSLDAVKVPILCQIKGDRANLAFMLVMACQAQPSFKNILESAVDTLRDKEAQSSLSNLTDQMKVIEFKK